MAQESKKSYTTPTIINLPIGHTLGGGDGALDAENLEAVAS